MKRASLILVLVFGAIFIVSFALLAKTMESMQKDTCKLIIEQTLVSAINQKIVLLKSPLKPEWKEIDLISRKQLLDFAQLKVHKDTECSDYSYLIKGEEADGTELPIFSKRERYKDSPEVRLGE